jgi:hypothetical protein
LTKEQGKPVLNIFISSVNFIWDQDGRVVNEERNA